MYYFKCSYSSAFDAKPVYYGKYSGNCQSHRPSTAANKQVTCIHGQCLSCSAYVARRSFLTSETSIGGSNALLFRSLFFCIPTGSNSLYSFTDSDAGLLILIIYWLERLCSSGNFSSTSNVSDDEQWRLGLSYIWTKIRIHPCNCYIDRSSIRFTLSDCSNPSVRHFGTYQSSYFVNNSFYALSTCLCT